LLSFLKKLVVYLADFPFTIEDDELEVQFCGYGRGVFFQGN